MALRSRVRLRRTPPTTSAAPTSAALTQNGLNPLRTWRPTLAVTQYAGGPFPPNLAVRLEPLLGNCDGRAVVDLLVTDSDSPYWELWSARNRELHADLVEAAFTTPLQTLERKISAGEIEGLEVLRRCLEQVICVCGRKFSRLSYRLLHPKDRHGQPRMLSGSDLTSDPVGGMPTPDELITAVQIPDLVREAASDLDRLHVGIFCAVQSYRVHVGKAGAYRFIALLLHFNAIGTPIQFRAPADVDLTVRIAKQEVNAVRRLFLAVRQVLAERLTLSCYHVPQDRKRRRRRK